MLCILLWISPFPELIEKINDMIRRNYLAKNLISRLKQNHLTLMWHISSVIISFFYFVFSFILIANFLPEPSKTNFNKSFGSLNIYEFIVLLLIISILFGEVAPSAIMNLKNRIVKLVKQVKNQKILIDYYPSLPVFLTTFGFFFSFIFALFKILFLVQIGLIIFVVGLTLWYIMFIIKFYLESQISFAIYEANRRISAINSNERQQIKQFVRLFNITLKNINSKFGKKIKINISKSGIYQFETLIDYLPNYLKMCGTRDIDRLKDHVERMSNSVGSDDSVNFKMFTNELIDLSKEIISFLEENNLKIMHRSSVSTPA